MYKMSLQNPPNETVYQKGLKQLIDGDYFCLAGGKGQSLIPLIRVLFRLPEHKCLSTKVWKGLEKQKEFHLNPSLNTVLWVNFKLIHLKTIGTVDISLPGTQEHPRYSKLDSVIPFHDSFS